MVISMEQLIKRLQQMMDMFFRITTGVLFVTAVYITVFWGFEEAIDVRCFWQILCVSALCALGALILICDGGKEISKTAMLVRTVAYFLLVNAIVLFCGFQFEWFYPDNWKMILGMELCIIGVFIVVTAAGYFAEYKIAAKMNEKLKERN